MNEVVNQSEQYFRELVDSSPAMLWVTREDGYCTYLSKQWYEFTGRQTHLDLGLGWTENIHPDDKEGAGIEFMRCSEQRVQYEVMFRLRRKDGQYRWVIDKGNPRFSSQGQFEGFMGTVIDIHEQVLAEKNIEKIRERFLRVAKATDLGIWYCDLPFADFIWNDQVKNHFWLPPEASVNIELFYERIHPDDRSLTKDAIDKAIADHTPYLIDYRTVNPLNSKQIKWIRAIGWTDYDSLGNPTRFDGITLDVSEEVGLRKDLEAALLARDEFLSVASHELRTPLTSILLQSQMLDRSLVLGTFSRDKGSSINGVIEHQVKRISRLVDDMLDISRIRTGKLTLNKQPTDMKVIVSDTIEKLANDFKKGKIKTPTVSITTELTFGSWDNMRIEQVMINLLSNAVKYGKGFPIAVLISSVNSSLQVKVSDQGLGIEESFKEVIFDRFERAISSNEVSGLGLGLYISKQIIESHGGKIWVESRVGKGSDFIFELPLT